MNSRNQEQHLHPMNLSNYASQPGPQLHSNDGSLSGQGMANKNFDEIAA